MISVVMPAYNTSAFIREAIDSILNQTYQAFELIIVDDGSTDGTLEIAQQYAADDSRVRVIANPHGGISSSLNTGLQAARYPWVAIMHADDVALPDRLKCQLAAALKDPEVAVWGSNGFHINGRGQVLSHFVIGPASKEECTQLRIRGELVQVIHPTAFMRRDQALAAGGYNSEFDAAEDVEFFERMLAFGSVVALQEPLIMYRVHSSSVTMQRYQFQTLVARYVQARMLQRQAGGEVLDFETYKRIIVERHGQQALDTNRHDHARLYYRHAGMAFSERHILQGMRYLLLAMWNNPLYVLPRLWRQTVRPAVGGMFGGRMLRIAGRNRSANTSH